MGPNASGPWRCFREDGRAVSWGGFNAAAVRYLALCTVEARTSSYLVPSPYLASNSKLLGASSYFVPCVSELQDFSLVTKRSLRGWGFCLSFVFYEEETRFYWVHPAEVVKAEISSNGTLGKSRSQKLVCVPQQ